MLSSVVSIVLGVTVLTVIGIAFGGTFLLRILTGGHAANALQKMFFRAGHAHAGVLVTLGLALAVLGAVSGVSPGWAGAGAILVPSAAIFVPLGVWSGACGATRNPVPPCSASTHNGRTGRSRRCGSGRCAWSSG